MKQDRLQVIVIDPFKKEIRYASLRNPKVDQSYAAFNDEIYELLSQGPIQVGMIEAAYLQTEKGTKQNCILVDEEGLLHDVDKQSFFMVKGAYSQPLAGIGVVTGMDKDGDSIEPTLSLEWFQERVSFHNLDDIKKMYEAKR